MSECKINFSKWKNWIHIQVCLTPPRTYLLAAHAAQSSSLWNLTCFSPYLSLASPFHLDKHTLYISLFTDGDHLPHGHRSHNPSSVSFAKDGMFTHWELAEATSSLSTGSPINLPRTAETKGCSVCAGLLGLSLPLFRGEKKAGRKESTQTTRTLPTPNSPSHLLHPEPTTA